MPIQSTYTTPSGATPGFHKVTQINYHAGDEAASVTVNSWATEAAYNTGAPLIWQQMHPLPLSALSSEPVVSAEAYLVSSEGPLAGGTIIAPISDAEGMKIRQWAAVKAARDEALHGSFTIDGLGTFDATRDSQLLIIGSVVLAQLAIAGGKPFHVDWTLADNSVISLDAMQMIAVGVALGAHIEAAFSAARASRAQIEGESVESDITEASEPIALPDLNKVLP
jgi:hypothetical protein